MNFRIARKILNQLALRLTRENFGVLTPRDIDWARHSRQQLARATVRCRRQQTNAHKLIVKDVAGTREFRLISLPVSE